MKPPIEIDIKGDAAVVQRIRAGLVNRRPLHARLAVTTEKFTKDYVAALHDRPQEHRTANRLGAKPTGEFIRASRLIGSASDDAGVTLRFPRASRLRAAFGTYTVRPRNVKYLTIPAHALAYGMRARELDGLKFRMFGHRAKALVFGEGPFKGKVAYWLVKEATINEDRGLLPFEQLPAVIRGVAMAYIAELRKGALA